MPDSTNKTVTVPSSSNKFSSGAKTTGAKRTENIKQQFDNVHLKIERLEERAEAVLNNIERNTNIILYVFVALGVTFVVAITGIWLDYSHNLDQQRNNFSNILEDYEKKSESKERENLLKDCINTYGLKFCVSRK